MYFYWFSLSSLFNLFIMRYQAKYIQSCFVLAIVRYDTGIWCQFFLFFFFFRGSLFFFFPSCPSGGYIGAMWSHSVRAAYTYTSFPASLILFPFFRHVMVLVQLRCVFFFFCSALSLYGLLLRLLLFPKYFIVSVLRKVWWCRRGRVVKALAAALRRHIVKVVGLVRTFYLMWRECDIAK